MRVLLAVALGLAVAGLACGGGSDDAAGGAQAPAQKKAAPQKANATQEEREDHLLSLVVWPEGSEPRDKQADYDACSEQVKPEPGEQGHPLVTIQKWMKCMEGYGWKRKA